VAVSYSATVGSNITDSPHQQGTVLQIWASHFYRQVVVSPCISRAASYQRSSLPFDKSIIAKNPIEVKLKASKIE